MLGHRGPFPHDPPPPVSSPLLRRRYHLILKVPICHRWKAWPPPWGTYYREDVETLRGGAYGKNLGHLGCALGGDMGTPISCAHSRLLPGLLEGEQVCSSVPSRGGVLPHHRPMQWRQPPLAGNRGTVSQNKSFPLCRLIVTSPFPPLPF